MGSLDKDSYRVIGIVCGCSLRKETFAMASAITTFGQFKVTLVPTDAC